MSEHPWSDLEEGGATRIMVVGSGLTGAPLPPSWGDAGAVVVEHEPDLDRARARARAAPPTLVLLALGGEDAVAWCAALRADERTGGAGVIAVAPREDRSLRLGALRAGVDHILVEPIDLDELTARGVSLLRATARARSAEADRRRLLAWHDWMRYLVHDLRSPVSVALSNLAFVLEDAGGETATVLDEARFELGRVVAMLQDLLDTDRLQRGVLVPRAEPLDIAALARKVAASVRVLAEARRTTVAVAAQGSTWAEADPALVERVLTNLVGNAVRYARARPVRLTVEEGAGRLRVRVANDGPAVSEALRRRIFEPFCVIEAGSITHGTGLGLAFCRLAVEAHGGRIWLDRGDEGDVVFAFTLPAEPVV